MILLDPGRCLVNGRNWARRGVGGAGGSAARGVVVAVILGYPRAVRSREVPGEKADIVATQQKFLLRESLILLACLAGGLVFVTISGPFVPQLLSGAVMLYVLTWLARLVVRLFRRN